MTTDIQVVDPGSGEIVSIVSHERFLAMTLQERGEAFVYLDTLIRKLQEIQKEIKPLMTASLYEQRQKLMLDDTKPVNLPVGAVTVCLPSGTKDKYLTKGDVEAIDKALNDFPEAHKECIKYEPVIQKAAVNKWRRIPGPVAELLLSFFQPLPKDVEIKYPEGGK